MCDTIPGAPRVVNQLEKTDNLVGTLVELGFIITLLVTLGIINWPG